MNWSNVVRFQEPQLTAQKILACWRHTEILKIQLFQLIYWHSVTGALKGFLLACEPTPCWTFSECCVTVTVCRYYIQRVTKPWRCTSPNSMANPNYMHIYIISPNYCFAKQSECQTWEITDALNLPTGSKTVMLLLCTNILWKLVTKLASIMSPLSDLSKHTEQCTYYSVYIIWQ